MKKISIEELKNGLGRTILTSWDEHLRIIDVKDTYILLDAPEKRSYYTNGKLTPMPMKKVYFDTTNQVWNIQALVSFDDKYVFKMKKFERETLVVNPEDVQPNILPSIEEAKKLKHPVIRRDKETLMRDKLMKDYQKGNL
jgi:hypothetical protein